MKWPDTTKLKAMCLICHYCERMQRSFFLWGA